MRVVKYVKYNRTKAPAFQVKTEIVQDGELEYVEKKALCPQARAHVEQFAEKYEGLKDVYVNCSPVEVRMVGDAARFTMVSGEGVGTILDECLEDTDTLISRIKEYCSQLFLYNEAHEEEWKETEGFRRVFGEVSLEQPQKAVCPANIDAIFDNFLVEGDAIWCIDYEWTFFFPVPQQFILFRALFYYYSNNQQYLKMTLEEFMEKFGIDGESCKKFRGMEDHFQQYAHGENRKYIYTNNYVKKNVSISHILANPEVAGDVLAGTVRRDEEIIRLNEVLHETIEDATKAHKKLQDTTRELMETHERLHNTTDELIGTHERLHERDNQLSSLREEIIEKDGHIANYQATIAKYHKMARNPVFAAGELGKAAGRAGKRVAKKVLPARAGRAASVLKNEGVDVLLYKVRNHQKSRNDYELWIAQNEGNQLYVEPLEYNPLISVVVPVYNVADRMLRECIDSVINQTYRNWELCLVDDCSTMESVRKVLSEYEGREQIKIKYRSENGHISRTTNDGIAMATGEFIGLMDCDDLLAPNALYEMARMLNANKDYDFIYSDEDKINEEGTGRRDPFFKPDWSPDTFMSYMYTCHFSVFRKSMIEKVGGLRIGYEGSQDYDLVLRIMEQTRNIGHVPKILYHWRMRKESTANDLTAKPYIVESTIKAKEDALMRRGLKGKLTCIEAVTQYRVTYIPQNNPMVSVIIPSKDNYEILRQCITSIRKETTYGNYEIVVVDNGSNGENEGKYRKLSRECDFTYFHEVKDFNFSYMCNKGASLAKGDLFLFLNDDIEIPAGQGEWMAIMAGQAQVSHTGAVGAKLVYPGTNLIQHVGVLNLPIGPGHAFHRFDDSLNFYWGRNILDYNFSIVTGACMMIDRNKFEEIKGFDETFPVAYNDVDICFKLINHGYYNVLRNDVKLVHHESISRGYDEKPEKAARLLAERERLYDKHPDFKGYDPCYNPNLTPDKGDFSLKLNGAGGKPGEVKDTDLRNYKENKTGISYNIDAVECRDGMVHVSGWAFLLGDGRPNHTPVGIVFVAKNKKAVVATTVRTYRPDVGAAHRDKGRVALTGFECIVDRKSLPFEEGTLKIGVAIGRYCVLTDRKVN